MQLEADILKSLRLRWYGHVESIQNQPIPKQLATGTMERTRKKEDHVTERGMRLKRIVFIVGTKTRQAIF
jgi:hypothetical protein